MSSVGNHGYATKGNQRQAGPCSALHRMEKAHLSQPSSVLRDSVVLVDLTKDLSWHPTQSSVIVPMLNDRPSLWIYTDPAHCPLDSISLSNLHSSRLSQKASLDASRQAHPAQYHGNGTRVAPTDGL